MTTIIAFTSGRESGIHWVRGFELQLDAEGVICWRDRSIVTHLSVVTTAPVFGVVTLEIELDDSTRDRLGVLSPCE
jgi:hypothetical protein